ncbi:MAG: undecaprenyl-diphosphate phosphatase [cyanobacterium endosymbiont of Rhopalodia musculus]|uniref:undecaprenyl-diphosphate phosphatase n=1 Tax=cyanobacterium endosymbiont of Epithemia clementina EcSB TaxID=3034674 RepID=UPI0024806D1D|nr:undecaprenyl-diphosphate phosphatase [cyanobacterium endosymbiont of Epithemia clementina EcSB]WGT67574.1 undecaprenyl-diphosphate phosphatase [cyanobacterium endosymbiont of Epithemia clementina EcSB]
MTQPKHRPLELIVFFAISSGLSLFLGSTTTVQSISLKVSDTPIFQFNWLQAIVLGMVQGLTEFLPISSTAHLKIVPLALGWGDPGVSFTAVIQLGSITAVIWYFWSDLTEIIEGMVKAICISDYKSYDFQLAAGIALGTLPIVFFGLLWKLLVSDLDNSPLRSVEAIAIASIVMAVLLALSEKLGTHKRDFRQLTLQDGVLIGLAQTLALIPGVSRSGSTMTAGLFINLERATAAKFSFLLGIPAITIAGFAEFKEVLVLGFSKEILFPVIVGVISSAIFSYLAIAWLTRYLQNRDTWIFVWYRLGFGVLILSSLVFNLN